MPGFFQLLLSILTEMSKASQLYTISQKSVERFHQIWVPIIDRCFDIINIARSEIQNGQNDLGSKWMLGLFWGTRAD